MMGDLSRFAQFWQNHPERREEINEARRRKYHENQTHREAIKAAAKSRYRPKKDRRPPKRGPNRPRFIAVDATNVVLIGLGESAQRLGVSKHALRGYDDKGIVPRNRFTDKLGRRWFPELFIAFLQPLLVDQRRRKDPLWRLQARVEEAWKGAVGIPRLPKEKSDGGEEARGGEDGT